MNIALRPVLSAALGVCVFVAHAQADEGLWLFHQPPRQLLKEKYDFKLSDVYLERLQKATVSVGRGGSGSFVSAEGLVLTNHHVALNWLEELGTDKNDLVENGFYAAQRSQELRCPGLDLRVVWSSEDVTARIHGTVKPDMTPAQAKKARRAAIVAVEKESLATTGLAGEVTALYHGGRYHLHRFKTYTDVRLVFAPARKRLEALPDAVPLAGAQFPAPLLDEYVADKFDVCFLRAYEEGKPARSPHWLAFAPKVPQTNELTLASGFPGTTNRFRTAADLEDLYGRAYWLGFKSAAREISALEAFAKQSPENNDLVKDEIAGSLTQASVRTDDLLNLEKRLAAKRALEKTEHAQLLARDKELAARQRQALKRIEASLREGEKADRRLYFLDSPAAALSTRLFMFAQYLLRTTNAAAETDADPVPESVLQDELSQLRGQFFSPKPIVKRLEIVKLAESLTFFESQAVEEDLDLLAKILNGRPPEKCASDLVNGSRLHELTVRKALLKGGKKAVSESNDPMIVLARLVDARARLIRREYDEKVTEPCRQAYAVLHVAREKMAAGSTYPDGCDSLRLSFGKVLAAMEPLGDLWTGYKLPKDWQTAKDRVRRSIPLALALQVDTAPGNSGSPVVDREGRMVGIVATHRDAAGSVSSDLLYNDEGSTGAVSARAILEVLDKVYEAGALVKELGGNVRGQEADPPAEVQPPGDALPPPMQARPSVAKRHKDLVPALISALKDADAEVVQAAAQALGNIGADAVGPLVEALQSKDKVLRAHAATGLAGQDAIPALLKALRDEEVSVRREAARALANVVQQPPFDYGFPPPPPPKSMPKY